MLGPILFVFLITAIALASPLAAFVLILMMCVGYLWLPTPRVVHVHVHNDDLEQATAAHPDDLSKTKINQFLEDNDSAPEIVRPMPLAANVEIGKPVLADDEWTDPRKVDAEKESEWMETTGLSVKDIHQVDTRMHKNVRRETLWSHTGKWTQQDKERYEIGRRRIEARIASQLRTDGNMVIEDDVENPSNGSSYTQDQPYASIMSMDHTVFHPAQSKLISQGSGDLASMLRSKF